MARAEHERHELVVHIVVAVAVVQLRVGNEAVLVQTRVHALLLALRRVASITNKSLFKKST